MLNARWSIQANKRMEILASQQSRIRESASGQDYTATVAAMSKTVAALSREIATAIRSLPHNKPPI